MASCTVTPLYNHHHRSSSELSLRLNWHCTHFPFPQPTVTAVLISVSLNLTIVGTSYKRSQTILVLLWLVHLTRHLFKVQPCSSMCENSFPFRGWIIFHGEHTLHFVYPLSCRWTLGLLPILALVNNAAINTGAHMPVSDPAFTAYPECDEGNLQRCQASAWPVVHIQHIVANKISMRKRVSKNFKNGN